MLISIIVATYNRCNSLKKALESLANQDNDGSFEFEVLIIDNNSNDGTRKFVDTELSKWWGRLRYFFEPISGKPYALNKGIKEARGGILAFTDDDVTLDKRWILSLVGCFNHYACDGVGGRVLPVYPLQTAAWIKDNPHEMAGVVVICDFGEETKPFHPGMKKFIGANFAFKKEIFKECGLFKTDLIVGNIPIGEDTELIQRLIQAKKILYYCGRALVWHPVDLKRLRLGFLARWHFSLGKIAAKSEYKEFEGKLVSWKGVPQYLFRGVVADFILLTLFFWDRRRFLKNFRGFFRKIGMIAEYRAMRQKTSGSGYAQS